MSDEQNVGQRKRRGENVGGENVGWPDFKIFVLILVAIIWVPERPDESPLEHQNNPMSTQPNQPNLTHSNLR